MKNRSKVILVAVLTIVLIGGGVVYKQWNSIEAILLSVGTTQEDTEKELEKNKEKLQTFLDGEENISVRDLTEEEATALREGKLTEEEVLELLTGNENPETKEEPSVEQKTPPDKTEQGLTESPVSETAKPTPKPTATPSSKPQATASASDQNVEKLIAKLYVQKSMYLGKLDAIESQARSEYLNLRYGGTEKQTARQQIMKKYLSQVSSWETTCDSVVNGILSEIRAELSRSGKDTSIVDTMKASYLEEKKLKKAYYLNRYMG